MPEIKAVIFDIDGTLSEENSWAVLALGMGGTHEEDLEIYNGSLNGTITQEEADRRILEMWKRQGLATRENFIKIFDGIKVRPGAKEVVDYLKSKNIRACLITGSMDMYAEIVAKKVGADEWYANSHLFWNAEGHIDSFSYIADQGALKLIQFKEFCQKNQLQPTECAVVGDGENDYEIFQESGKGIAIKSFMEDPMIEKYAWKTIKNLSDIKEII